MDTGMEPIYRPFGLTKRWQAAPIHFEQTAKLQNNPVKEN
jgi:hypothetical protein